MRERQPTAITDYQVETDDGGRVDTQIDQKVVGVVHPSASNRARLPRRPAGRNKRTRPSRTKVTASCQRAERNQIASARSTPSSIPPTAGPANDRLPPTIMATMASNNAGRP